MFYLHLIPRQYLYVYVCCLFVLFVLYAIQFYYNGQRLASNQKPTLLLVSVFAPGPLIVVYTMCVSAVFHPLTTYAHTRTQLANTTKKFADFFCPPMQLKKRPFVAIAIQSHSQLATEWKKTHLTLCFAKYGYYACMYVYQCLATLLVQYVWDEEKQGQGGHVVTIQYIPFLIQVCMYTTMKRTE